MVKGSMDQQIIELNRVDAVIHLTVKDVVSGKVSASIQLPGKEPGGMYRAIKLADKLLTHKKTASVCS